MSLALKEDTHLQLYLEEKKMSKIPWTLDNYLRLDLMAIRVVEFSKLSFFESAILNFFCQKNNFCLIPIKISHKLCDRMDGTQFWCFLWFPANSLLCVILRYTVYIAALSVTSVVELWWQGSNFSQRQILLCTLDPTINKGHHKTPYEP